MAAAASRRVAAVAFATVVLGAATAGCAGSRVDKAGGSAKTAPLVLPLAVHDSDYAFGAFASAVSRLSGGSMHVRIATDWRDTPAEIDYERGIVADVRSGKIPLGIVGVRVWDTLGVPSFQALVAPFLIESLELEGRALESDFAGPALATVSRRGVVGIAILPGFLRRPFGVTRPLLAPSDYRRATIGIRPGGVARATFAALGGTAHAYAAGDLTKLDGAELDLVTITNDVFDRHSRPLTGNVVLWPKAQTIVMNRASFDRLTPRQREILHRAGREALAPELAHDVRYELYETSLICNAGSVRIATATRAERVALHASVEPVYRLLERDPFTRAWIAQISRIRARHATGRDSVRCP